MNAPVKSSSLQAYRLILYRRALHPELFEVLARRITSQGNYAFETWILPAGHLMRFQYEGACATELVTCQEVGIPDRGVVIAMPCAGEREHEEELGEKIKYLSSVQTEQLPESLYRSTYDELVAFGEEGGALMHTWTDEDGGRCASIVDIQRFRREIHAQAYHLSAQGGLVLRSQVIFEQMAAVQPG